MKKNYTKKLVKSYSMEKNTREKHLQIIPAAK